MDNEEIQDQGVEEIETDDSSNVTEEEPKIDGEVEPQLTVDDYRKLEATNKKLYARLKAEEAKAKELAEKINTKPLINQEQVSRDELVLIAKGEDEEVIDKAKVLAKGSGISLKEALADPMIVAFKEKKTEEAKSKAAQLGGSGRSMAKSEQIIKPGMDRDAHKEAWKKLTGN
jgi:hypothetical protein